MPSLDAARPAGFTLVEVLVAALVLAIGILGAFTLVDTREQAIGDNNGRVGATNLAREITEYARGTDYDLLTPTRLVRRCGSQKRSPARAGGTWKIVRRGVSTRHARRLHLRRPEGRARRPRTAGTPARRRPRHRRRAGRVNPDDFRRVTLDLRWNDRSGTHRT